MFASIKFKHRAINETVVYIYIHMIQIFDFKQTRRKNDSKLVSLQNNKALFSWAVSNRVGLFKQPHIVIEFCIVKNAQQVLSLQIFFFAVFGESRHLRAEAAGWNPCFFLRNCEKFPPHHNHTSLRQQHSQQQQQQHQQQQEQQQ